LLVSIVAPRKGGFILGEVKMKGTPAIYLGRIIDKKHFRTFVYGSNGEKKLIESWDAFEAAMQSGIWFASLEDAKEIKDIGNNIEDVKNKAKLKQKSKSKPKSQAKPLSVEEDNDAEDVLLDDETVFEMTDDFLPKEGE
jgi:hypothetical protein